MFWYGSRECLPVLPKSIRPIDVILSLLPRSGCASGGFWKLLHTVLWRSKLCFRRLGLVATGVPAWENRNHGRWLGFTSDRKSEWQTVSLFFLFTIWISCPWTTSSGVCFELVCRTFRYLASLDVMIYNVCVLMCRLHKTCVDYPWSCRGLTGSLHTKKLGIHVTNFSWLLFHGLTVTPVLA